MEDSSITLAFFKKIIENEIEDEQMYPPEMRLEPYMIVNENEIDLSLEHFGFQPQDHMYIKALKSLKKLVFSIEDNPKIEAGVLHIKAIL